MGVFIIYAYCMKKYLLWFIPLALIALLVILAPHGKITVPVNTNSIANTNSTTNTADDANLPTAYATYSYAGEDGKTAFQLLDEKYSVVSQQFDFGVMVKSIESDESTDSRYWLYYVNGQQPTVGADVYQTKEGDTILWRLEQATI